MKYAAKLLSQSDLTLFAAFFRLHPSSKQKGINLNGEVIAGDFYPTLQRGVTGSMEVPVVLDIYGPGGAGLHRQQRKIVKSSGGKNWRLNGKLIEEPANEVGRYGTLSPGDLAVFAFDGEALPSISSMVLLAASQDRDHDLVARIRDDLGLMVRVKSMVSFSASALETFSTISDATHPIRLLQPDDERAEDLVDATSGDDRAISRLFERAAAGKMRAVSAVELAARRLRAEEVGRAGEELISLHLEKLKAVGGIKSFVWSSDQNAVSPYDFELYHGDGSKTFVDVKSTTGKFVAAFHISSGELAVAAGETDYCIARVYGVDSTEGARLKMSRDISHLAREVLAALRGLPSGVGVASVQIDPDRLEWGQEELLPGIEDDDSP